MGGVCPGADGGDGDGLRDGRDVKIEFSNRKKGVGKSGKMKQ